MPQAPFFIDLLILLSAAVIAVPLLQRLRIGPVLGYLVAGLAIGPHGLKLIHASEDIHTMADLGVVFLLFAIGLELKPARLLVMRRTVFGLGTLQVLATTVVLALLGRMAGLNAATAVVAGGGLALSSTAVSLQILTERGELNTRTGRVAFAVLLLQDLAVVPLLAIVAMLANDGPSVPQAIGLAVLQAVAALAGIVAIGRLLLRPLLRMVAMSRSTDIFAAAAVLVVLGTAWVTGKVGLNMALGAFLAGLLLAETEFRHQVEADIQPFRGFLLGLFFMTVGMSIDLGVLVNSAGTVAGMVLGLVAIKTLLLMAAARMFRMSWALSLHVGLLLAQGGEFAFILFGLSVKQEVMAAETAQLLTLTVSLTMMLTPLLAAISSRLATKLAARESLPAPATIEEAGELHDHLIIAGFGRVGQTVARMIEAEDISYVALDLSPERVAEGLAQGRPVFYADAGRTDVLRLAGADRARALVVTLDRPGDAERSVAICRHAFPELRIFVRARDRRHGATLRALGATLVVPETLEASLQLGGGVLRALGHPTGGVNGLMEEFRANDYARLSGLSHDR